jgi:Fe-Mn family superoxide dismutase
VKKTAAGRRRGKIRFRGRSLWKSAAQVVSCLVGGAPAAGAVAAAPPPQGESTMTHPNRRQMLRTAGAGLAAAALSPLYAVARDAAKADAEGFTLPKLPYDYEALEPSIDKETMQIHHDKHHAAYVKNLNDALMGHPDFVKMDVVDVLKNVGQLPKDIQQKVINNGGGHLNHSMFWVWMAPKGKGEEGPGGELAKAIDAAFGDFGKFKDKMKAAALGRFGSGWAWLVLKEGKLDVVSTANQNTPLIEMSAPPILGVDVWEHAYYLKYHQDRGKYVDAWWDVVNWKAAGDRYADATKMK